MPGLVVAILLLLVPPVLAGRWTLGPAWQAALEGLGGAVIFGLIFLHILPEAVHAGGAGGLALGAVGLGLPLLAEGNIRGRRAIEGALLLVAPAALLVHAAVDGVALAVGEWRLAASVLFHQMPVSWAVYTSMDRHFNRRVAYAAVLGMIAATVFGYFAGGVWAASASQRAIGLFTCFAAGGVLHVVAHDGLGTARARPWAAVGGAALGLILVVAGQMIGGHG